MGDAYKAYKRDLLKNSDEPCRISAGFMFSLRRGPGSGFSCCPSTLGIWAERRRTGQPSLQLPMSMNYGSRVRAAASRPAKAASAAMSKVFQKAR